MATTTRPPTVSTGSTAGCRRLEQPASDVSKAFSGADSIDLQSASKALDEPADKAPSEIHDDFQVLAQAYDKIAAALRA